MQDILKLIEERQSSRAPFDAKHPIARKDLIQILEAGSWAPTAHNMQNFEIIVIDDKKLLEKIGNIKSQISEVFLKENYQQLSFSVEEFLRKKFGLLGTNFPVSWRNPEELEKIASNSSPSSLSNTIKNSPAVLIVVYDTRKRAPASEGDFLGIMSLGCVMENMWIMATSLGIGFQIMSVFGAEAIEKEIKQILNIPEYLKIAFASRLGYPSSKGSKYLRVRRNVEDFTHHNKFGSKYLI
jgi:nitroreductase